MGAERPAGENARGGTKYAAKYRSPRGGVQNQKWKKIVPCAFRIPKIFLNEATTWAPAHAGVRACAEPIRSKGPSGPGSFDSNVPTTWGVLCPKLNHATVSTTGHSEGESGEFNGETVFCCFLSINK